MQDNRDNKETWDRLETEGMISASKKDLVEKNHPVIRQMKEIRGIVFGDVEEQLPKTAISLKELFSREMVDTFHVNHKTLLKIACVAEQILDQLAQHHICMGLGDLADVYTDPAADFEEVYFCHPERFQLLDFEQDYEWYPEDEKLLGELVLFDDAAQELADCRFLYKILVGSTKSGVKIPPRMNENDYVNLFYQKLTPSLKNFYENMQGQSRSELRNLLYQAYNMEKEEELCKAASEKKKDKSPEEEGGNLYCMYVILRTDLNQSIKTGRLLYDLEDAMNLECHMTRAHLHQCFVHGDGHIWLREMQEDSPAFRMQLKNRISSYSSGEALLMAAEYCQEKLLGKMVAPKEEIRCILIFDGNLQNTCIFQYAMEKLHLLKEKGIHFYLTSDQEYDGEACQQLKTLLRRQEDYYVIKNVEEL